MYLKVLLLLVSVFVGFGLEAQFANRTSESIEFSVTRGVYTDAVEVELSASSGDIYYTTDGNPPSKTSRKYSSAIDITSTTCLRAVAVTAAGLSKTFTSTYVIGDTTKMPILALSVTPSVLFDKTKGIFEKGPNAEEEFPHTGANYWTRKEYIVNAEFFETDGSAAFEGFYGFRIFGGMSRTFPQKSFSLTARETYGKKRIKHRVFSDRPFKKYKHLVFRNSGSDNSAAMFRDGFMTGLMDDSDVDVQAFRSCIVYVNGRFYGLYNIREKLNRHYIGAHHRGVDKDSIDLLEHQETANFGSNKRYKNFIAWIKNQDLSDEAAYQELQLKMNVSNFMDLQIAQIFFDNRDAGGNIKFWSSRIGENQRWNWILYDTDFGFGMYDKNSYRHNSIQFFTKANGPSWPNPPWSTLILRKLLENESFRTEFSLRFTDYLNSRFREKNTLEQLSRFEEQLAPEMPRHLKRWKRSMKSWQKQVDVMRTFADKRPGYVRLHLQDFFSLGEFVNLEIRLGQGGEVTINNNIKTDEPFHGLYYSNQKTVVKANPKNGYVFVGWKSAEGYDESVEKAIDFSRGDVLLEPVFAPLGSFMADAVQGESSVIITEWQSSKSESEDWIEFMNMGTAQINLQNWTLSDDASTWVLPDGLLEPGEIALIVRDSMKFRALYPELDNQLLGNFSFGLSGTQDDLIIKNAEGQIETAWSYTTSANEEGSIEPINPFEVTNGYRFRSPSPGVVADSLVQKHRAVMQAATEVLQPTKKPTFTWWMWALTACTAGLFVYLILRKATNDS